MVTDTAITTDGIAGTAIITDGIADGDIITGGTAATDIIATAGTLTTGVTGTEPPERRKEARRKPGFLLSRRDTDQACRCARNQTPKAITTAKASANQVMAYCR